MGKLSLGFLCAPRYSAGVAELLGYHVTTRRRVGPWLLLLAACHVAGSYGIDVAWAVHQAATHHAHDMPWAIAVLMPLLSPIVLLRSLIGLAMFASRTWGTGLTVFVGYSVGFGVALAAGL